MSAPPTDVVDRLQRLAAGAPGGGVDPDALWTRGRRRQRVRTGVVAAALVVVGLVGATTTPLLVDRAQQVAPAGPADRMVLPDLLRQPGGWEPAFPSNPGRLSAVGGGTREGLWSIRNAWWGVSASTGESRFLELPGAADGAGPPALSADGWRLAYWVTGDVRGEPLTMSAPSDDGLPVVGVAVLDLRTGARDVWTVPSEHGLATNGLAWAGDVLWWAAGPIAQLDSNGVTARDITARTWDVTTDERDDSPSGAQVVSGNSTGDAPGGFVEQRGARRVVLVSGKDSMTRRLQLPAGTPASAGVMDLAVSTDGERLATLLQPVYGTFDDAQLSLLVGPVGGGVIPLATVDGIDAQSVEGWRSSSKVVLASLADVEESRPRRALRASAVDVMTGERTELLEFSGNAPQVAAEAWTSEVVPAPDAPFAPDPRLVGLALLAGSFVVWRLVVRVRRRRGDA